MMIAAFQVVIVSSADIALVDNYRPCIVQQYFNHDATLFKVYVLGEDVMIYRRKSLPNLSVECGPLRSVAFDSRLSYPCLEDFLPPEPLNGSGEGVKGPSPSGDSCSRERRPSGTLLSM